MCGQKMRGEVSVTIEKGVAPVDRTFYATRHHLLNGSLRCFSIQAIERLFQRGETRSGTGAKQGFSCDAYDALKRAEGYLAYWERQAVFYEIEMRKGVSMWPFRRQAPTPSEHPTWKRTLTPSPIVEQRTYLADVPYLLPKDVQEDQRLHYQHHVLYKTISNHYLAPLYSHGQAMTILDVGCGTGIWPTEMTVLFPQAHIIGVDVVLSSLPHPLPPSCLFAQANILEGLPFPNQQFTYTHQRLLAAAIPAVQWPGVVRELVRVTRVGGWVELLEIGDTIQNAGPATRRLLTWMAEIGKGLGFESSVLKQLGALLTEAGCGEVESQDIVVPLGVWAGQVGQMMQTDLLNGYHALKGTFCPRSNTPPEVFEGMVQAAAAEWEQNQASYVFHAAFGRRKVS